MGGDGGKDGAGVVGAVEGGWEDGGEGDVRRRTSSSQISMRALRDGLGDAEGEGGGGVESGWGEKDGGLGSSGRPIGRVCGWAVVVAIVYGWEGRLCSDVSEFESGFGLFWSRAWV